jgi:hypothetical protein
MWISVLRRLHPKRRGSDAVAVGGVADHLRLPSERGTWPSKLAAMIMRRVGRVNSCHRPLPGYALALAMSVRAPGCRRGCGWAGGRGAKPADLPVGTGLGLVISKRFCQMMGGDITVESEPGAASLCYLAERWRGCSPHPKVDRLAALSRRLERSFSGPCSLIKLFFQFRIDASKTSSHFPSKIHVLNSALH